MIWLMVVSSGNFRALEDRVGVAEKEEVGLAELKLLPLLPPPAKERGWLGWKELAKEGAVGKVEDKVGGGAAANELG
jgi:hypothetical protein